MAGPEEIETPKVFCHLAGYPPEQGEDLRQYLERVTPMLGREADKKNPEQAKTSVWVWLILGAMAWLALATLLWPLFT